MMRQFFGVSARFMRIKMRFRTNARNGLIPTESRNSRSASLNHFYWTIYCAQQWHPLFLEWYNKHTSSPMIATSFPTSWKYIQKSNSQRGKQLIAASWMKKKSKRSWFSHHISSIGLCNNSFRNKQTEVQSHAMSIIPSRDLAFRSANRLRQTKNWPSPNKFKFGRGLGGLRGLCNLWGQWGLWDCEIVGLWWPGGHGITGILDVVAMGAFFRQV